MPTADAIINDDTQLTQLMWASEHLHCTDDADIRVGTEIPGRDGQESGLTIKAIATEMLAYSESYMKGYQGWLVEDEQGNTYIIHDNTHKSDRKGDMMTDAAIINDRIPEQMEYARLFTETARKQHCQGQPLTHFGHSLGGALALMTVPYTEEDHAVVVENLTVGRQIERILEAEHMPLDEFHARTARLLAINENGIPNAVACGQSCVENTHLIELPILDMPEREPPTDVIDSDGKQMLVVNARRLTHPKSSDEENLQEEHSKGWQRVGHRIANLPAQIITGQRMFGFPAWTAISHDVGTLCQALETGNQRMTYAQYQEKFAGSGVDIHQGQAATYKLYLQDGQGEFWDKIKQAKDIEDGSRRDKMHNLMRGVEGMLAGLMSGSWRTMENFGRVVRAFIDKARFIMNLASKDSEELENYKEMEEGSLFQRFMHRVRHAMGRGEEHDDADHEAEGPDKDITDAAHDESMELADELDNSDDLDDVGEHLMQTASKVGNVITGGDPLDYADTVGDMFGIGDEFGAISDDFITDMIDTGTEITEVLF